MGFRLLCLLALDYFVEDMGNNLFATIVFGICGVILIALILLVGSKTLHDLGANAPVKDQTGTVQKSEQALSLVWQGHELEETIVFVSILVGSVAYLWRKFGGGASGSAV